MLLDLDLVLKLGRIFCENSKSDDSFEFSPQFKDSAKFFNSSSSLKFKSSIFILDLMLLLL